MITAGCSGAGPSNPENPPAQESPTVPQDVRQVADQLSLAFESASDKISPSVVPIFAEQAVTPANPFGMPSDPLEQFFAAVKVP